MLEAAASQTQPISEVQPGEVAWESLLEVVPGLGQCRVLLRCKDKRSVQGEDTAALDHTTWSVAVGLVEHTLNITLSPQADSELEATIVGIPIDKDIQIASNSLRCYSDHLCLSMSMSTVSPWIQEVMNEYSNFQEDEIHDVRCRNCRSLLLEATGKQAFVLPSTWWQNCSDVLACEECAPLGATHIQAAQSRIYISPSSLLVCTVDLLPGAVLHGRDSLVHCGECNFVVGEANEKQGIAQRRPSARPLLNLSQAWRSRAGCSNAPISLYKHRVSMPKTYASPPSDIGAMAKQAPVQWDDVLAAFTEEAAVGMQLLSMRAQTGHSRFVLLPSCPSSTQEVEVVDQVASAEALEIRIVVAEVLLVGPQVHVFAHDAKPSRKLRAAKVCYRRCSCTSTPASASLVVVPHPEFQAVCGALDWWTTVLPTSLQAGLPLGKQDGPPWLTSYLPLPPPDRGLE
jgi:hypothetical protein